MTLYLPTRYIVCSKDAKLACELKNVKYLYFDSNFLREALQNPSGRFHLSNMYNYWS